MPITSSKVDAYARALASQGASFVSPTGSGLLVGSGTVVKPSITYNAGGTITMDGTGTYRFFHTTNYSGEVSEHTIEETTLNVPDLITSYIVANYNSGTPQYSVTTDLSTVNFSNNVVVYTVSRVGDTNVDILDWDEPGLGLSNKILRRDMEARRFERVTGLSLGEDTGRKVVISAGVVWQGSFRNSRIQVDSVTNYCEQVVTDAGGNWTGSIVTAYNNSQFDNGNGLTTLTDGNYAVNWIYRGMGINAENIIILLGTGDYDINQAKTAQPPNNAPLSTSTNAMLVGKIIVQKGAVTVTQIDSAFVTQFAPSATSSHSGLTNLEGGDATHHYHSDQEVNKDKDVAFNSVTITTDFLPKTTIISKLGSLTKVFLNVFTRKVESDDDLILEAGTDKSVTINNNVDLNNKTLRLKTPNLTDIGEDNGISFYEGNDNYKIGYDSVGGTKGYLRYNVDLVDIGHGHIFSAGDLATGETDLMLVRADGNVSIGTSDLDGTPSIGKLVVKGSTNDGTTNILVGRDSDEVNVFEVDTNGKLTTKEVYVNTIVTSDGTNGYVTINSGSADRTGFFEWKTGNGTRLGYMGDGSDSVILAMDNGAHLKISGYTKLGLDAPAIKFKEISGTTPTTVSAMGSYTHGLTKSKILGVQVVVENSDGTLILPHNGHPYESGDYYYAQVTDTVLAIHTAANSTSILNKPFRAIITYKE